MWNEPLWMPGREQGSLWRDLQLLFPAQLVGERRPPWGKHDPRPGLRGEDRGGRWQASFLAAAALLPSAMGMTLRLRWNQSRAWRQVWVRRPRSLTYQLCALGQRHFPSLDFVFFMDKIELERTSHLPGNPRGSWGTKCWGALWILRRSARARCSCGEESLSSSFWEGGCLWCRYHIVGLDAVGAEGGCHQAGSLLSIRVRLVTSSVLFKGWRTW